MRAKKRALIVLPRLNAPGGVSSFWNAILPEVFHFENIDVKIHEIGGHGKNILGPFQDQYTFIKKIKKPVDFAVLNPSLGMRSFFRDGLFAKQLHKRKILFAVFFHGWDKEFEEKVTQKYVRFFKKSFCYARVIFVLSENFKNMLIRWGYTGEIIVETTTVNKNLLKEYDFGKKLVQDQQSNITRILFLSRLVKTKGIYETIEAFNNLSTKYESIELTIAGDGEEYDRIEKLTRNNPSIRMVGHVEGKEKQAIFKESQIYCLPSYTEGLPTTVLEAMAFGLPVITSPVGGLKDFFQNGKMGYFAVPRNAQDLYEKLDLLLANRSEISAIGSYNYTYAHKNSISDKVAKRLFDQLEILNCD